jgi:hypothetical protein
MIPAFSVARYLESLPHIGNVHPVRVTIGEESFLGAIYTSQHADQSTPSRRLYLLGETPAVWRKAGRTRQGESRLIFTFEDQDWYAGGGYTPFLLKPFKRPADFPAEIRQYHPFGHYFDISMWPTNQIGRIDKYDDKPRKRVPMNVEYLA